jgi:hypothetical protein
MGFVGVLWKCGLQLFFFGFFLDTFPGLNVPDLEAGWLYGLICLYPNAAYHIQILRTRGCGARLYVSTSPPYLTRLFSLLPSHSHPLLLALKPLHPDLDHRTLHQRLPAMYAQALLQRNAHLALPAREHLVVVRLHRRCQRLRARAHRDERGDEGGRVLERGV